jgi:hypothetical protein
LRIDLVSQKYFHLSGEMFLACGARRRLSTHSSAAAKEASGNDASVIENNQLIAPQQIGKIYKKAILHATFETREHKEARRVATIQRALGNLAGSQVVIEVVKTHRQPV